MADNEKQEPREKVGLTPDRPAIIGIGASAGGVRTLQTFFDQLDDRVGAALVVVVHLDPFNPSELAAILAAHTAMPVTQVGAAVLLEPDHVYVIPPNRRLRISDGFVSAEQFDEPRGQRAPIDLFFRSMAEQHGDGFAVILSGAGSDGSVGIKAVKEAGGVIIVQDPNEAEYASMPRSAVATEMADFVLPVHEIAARLPELVRTKKLAEGGLRDVDEEYVRRILAHLNARTGHDFSRYKRSTVLRRIGRRIQVTGKERLDQYYAYLRENADEVQALFGDLLISVTTFFRDKKCFDTLAEKVIPRLFEGKNADGTIRIWVAGCATGEEAYTVAVLLLEEAGRHELRPEIQVFGSDLDPSALAVAREGCYPLSIEADVSEERLRRFFAQEGDHYRVKRELRDIILFANHSMLKDPPFSRLDLILCRNLLIYLDRELQQQAINIFSYALLPSGFLFLGSSETADHPANLFRTIDRQCRIYQSAGRKEDFSVLPRLFTSARIGEPQPLQHRPRTSPPPNGWGDMTVHRSALEKFAPPSILVDENYTAVHLTENAGRFLQPSGGPLRTDVIELMRPELRVYLRAALNRAFEHASSTFTPPVPVQFNGVAHRVQLYVTPVQTETSPRAALILFMEASNAEGAQASGMALPEEGESGEVIRLLREELHIAHDRLRTTREEAETVNEELRATNEELQSINEEYRSTSEELETSKEELQSINEELQTVNSELKQKLDGISRAHSDLQNLMTATDYGTLFLDTSLRIKLFTPRVADLFNITAGDVGRPITDFTHRLQYEELSDDGVAVLDKLVSIEKEIRSENGKWYLVRLRPYRTIDNKIDGVVVTFMDITARRETEEALRASEDHLRRQSQLVELSRTPIFAFELDGGITEWNRGSEELYGYSRDEALGKQPIPLLKTSIRGSSPAAFKKRLIEEGGWSGELQHTTKDQRVLTVEAEAQLVTMGGQQIVLQSTRDITDRKAWEARQHMLLGELTHRVKNTLAVVQSIAHQTLRTSKSTKQFAERFDGRLMALASAHKLLVESNWRGTDLTALAREQLGHYTDGGTRARVTGETVSLTPELATPLALILHELATNAAKFGSLSTPTGTVDLSWKTKPRNGKQSLTVTWKERGGPPVKQPRSSGFGSTLIAKGLPGATIRHEFPADGVECVIELSLADPLATDGTD